MRDPALSWTVLRPSGFMSNALRWLPQLRAGDTVREPFADLPLPDDEARRDLSANMPAPIVDALFEFSRGRTYLDDQVTGVAAGLLGRSPRTFRDWAHAHASGFGP